MWGWRDKNQWSPRTHVAGHPPFRRARSRRLFKIIVWLVFSYFSWIISHLPTERIDSLCLDIQSRGDLDFFLLCSLWAKPLLRSHRSRSSFVSDSFRVVCNRRCSCSNRQSLHAWRLGIDQFDIWCKRFHWFGLQTVLDCICGKGKNSNCYFFLLLLTAWVEGLSPGDPRWWDRLIGWREPALGSRLMLEAEPLPLFLRFLLMGGSLWTISSIASKGPFSLILLDQNEDERNTSWS